MATSGGRRTGCQRPFTQEQVTAVSGQIAFSALFYAACIVSTQREYLIIPLILYTIPLAVLLTCWVYCVAVDPSKPGGIPCARMARTQARERWCRVCYKSVPGLDHHCTWLNTCIGTRTYAAFFCLACAGTVQYTLQLLLCILVATLWRVEGISTGYYVFLAIVAALGGVGVAAFGSLAGFHVYLLYRGFGTYDWILDRAERRMAAMASAPLPPVTLPAPAPVAAPNDTTVTAAAEMHEAAANAPPPSLQHTFGASHAQAGTEAATRTTLDVAVAVIEGVPTDALVDDAAAQASEACQESPATNSDTTTVEVAAAAAHVSGGDASVIAERAAAEGNETLSAAVAVVEANIE